MIEIRLAEAAGEKSKEKLSQDIFSEKFLVKRPLARALEGKKGAAPVLLIDELDRTDEPFEAYLLEVLSDWQITDPGDRHAARRGAADRRHHLEPHARDPRRGEAALLLLLGGLSGRRARAGDPAAQGAARSAALSKEVVAFVQRLRTVDLFKLPGVAETIDWANCLVALDRIALDPETVNNTLGVLLKYQDDLARMAGEETERLVSEAKAAATAA